MTSDTPRNRTHVARRAAPWLVLALLLLPALAHAVTVSILPADTTVQIGDTLVVRIVTDGVPDLRAFETIHQYDPTRLELVSVDPGGLLTGSGHPYSAHLRGDYTAPHDSLWYDAAVLGGSASGPGVLAFARFRAIGLGDDALDCRKVEFRDALNQPTIPSCVGAMIHVQPVQRSLVVATVGSGSVAADPAQPTYDDGTSVSLTATPATCWHFAGWSGSASGAANPLALVMNANRSVTATFAIDTHVLDSSAGAGGSITPSGLVTVDCGTAKTFTITPGEGYAIADVVVDGLSRGPAASYAFSDVTTEHTIAASFTIIEYTLAVSPTGSGTVTRAPDLATYPHFTGVTVNATPATGWHFVGWSGDTTATTPAMALTMKRDRTLHATFAIDTHTLTVTRSGLGSVAVSPAQALYDYGTVVMLTPTASPGWFFTGWSGGATGDAIPLTLTMDADLAVTAHFGYTAPTPAELTLGGHDETTEDFTGAGAWNASSGAVATPGYVAAGVTGTHLLISEVGSRGLNSATVNDSTEFIEIFNPMLTAVDLSRFYIADVNGYAALPVSGKIDIAASLTDFAFRFPAGATIGPGEAKVVAVVAGSYKRGANRDADYTMFGAGSVSTAQPMVDVMKNKSVGYPGFGMLSNTGEFVWLFYWDGACDVVTDVDLVSWGAPTGANAPSLKTPFMCQDSYDTGSGSTCYMADAGPIGYLATPANGAGTRQRVGPESETASAGGNGQTLKATPAVALGSSPASPTCETPLTLTATLAPAAPAGVVTFYEGATLLGSAPVSAGVASLSGLVFTAGSHTFSAVFGGDCSDLGSTSPDAVVSITQAASALSLATVPNPSVCEQSVSLTATVTPAHATGSVSFLDGVTVIGTAPIVSGVASLATSALALGSHSLSATYAGTACILPTTSNVLAHDVQPIPTVTTVTSDQPATTCGLPFTLVAHVTPAASGTAEFFDGATSLGSAPVAAGTGSLPVPGLTVATHPITAVFTPADACHAGGTSAVMNEVVSLAPLAVALGADVNPTQCEGAVTLTATVLPPGATGTVEFKDGATSLGVVPVASGTASLVVTTLTVGAHTLTATYGGDACYATAVSPDLAHIVDLAPSSVALGSALNPSTCGAAVGLTATVTPSGATGSVEFFDGVASLGSSPVSAGAASLSVSALTVATHGLTAVYHGDACYAPATSAALSQVVDRAASAVALAGSGSPAACGSVVSLTATVTPSNASGGVEFFDGATSLGTSAVAGGTATLPVSTLAVGAHALTAVYSGDGCYAGAGSPALAQDITAVPTTLALGCDVSPATCGSPVTLTATVTPAGAAGTVEFFDGVTSLGSASLIGGTASLMVPSLDHGVRSLTASYAGGGCHAPSVSMALVLPVNPATPTVSLGSAANPTTCAAAVTLVAQVLPASASGSVEFREGATTLGVRSLVGGTATLVLPAFVVGTHALTAIYSGDACVAAGSADLSLVVDPAPVSVSLGSAPLPSVCEQATLLTATVAPASVVGQIEFFDGAAPLGSGPIVAGVATLLVPGFTAGTHPLTASFAGDACLSAAVSPIRSHLVNRAPVTVALGADVNPAAWGATVTLTATLNPAVATGSVEFFDGPTSLGSVPASAGSASLPVSALEVGPHALAAVYSGDLCYAPGASSPLAETVTRTPSAVALGSDVNPSSCGGTVVLTASLTPPLATGSVQFMDGATPLGDAPVSAGVASLPVSGLVVGGHPLVALYSGDAHYAPAASPTLAQTVAPGVSSVTLASDVNPSVHGSAVVFTAAVTPPLAAGSVRFVDSLTVIGEAPVTGGVATLSISTLAGGAHTQVVAVFSGDGCADSSRSAPWTQIVHRGPTTTSVAADLNPAFVGSPLTLTAHVDPAGATGSVEFFDGAVSLGSGAIVEGVATLVLTPAAEATLDLTARYPGDDSNDASVSPPLSLPVIIDAPPAVTVSSPNGGEVLILGTTATLTWSATDDHGVASVSISVSRDSGATWQDIATGLANTGSYDWLVTPPQTNVSADPRFTALIRVIAHDTVNRSGADESDGTFAIFSANTDVPSAGAPGEFALSRVWPNPAHGAVRIDYAVAAESQVRLSLVDLMGREVAVLANGRQAPGRYQVLCDGRAAGAPLPAGVYFVRFAARGTVFTRRFVLVR